MRPLTDTQVVETRAKDEIANGDSMSILQESSCYTKNLDRLKQDHHAKCLFNRQPSVVPDLQFSFDDNGVLHGELTCNGFHQGYTGMVHGGVIAAIIDASMAQCLMGHGVAGYTAHLSIRYSKPVLIHTPTRLTTSVTAIHCGCFYTILCEIFQSKKLVVKATGKFVKVKEHST